VEQEHDPNRTELSKLEIELCKQNFSFYDRNRVGSVERFELPMLLNGKLALPVLTVCSLRVLSGREEACSAEPVSG